MKLLVWHWGRRGAGPRFAAALADGLNGLPGTEAALSLSAEAEILALPDPPACALPIHTYTSAPALGRRLLRARACLRELDDHLSILRPDVAICAMPAPLDLLMATALRRRSIAMVVIVHDAERHPGDGFPLQMTLQRQLTRRAAALLALSGHVARKLARQRLAGTDPAERPLLRSAHPPLALGPFRAAPRPAGPPRFLLFGRLLSYKGLDLLGAAWERLDAPPGAALRVVGRGPESAALARLRRLPGVTVENRWVPESELADLLGWADACVLSHTEASQSGVAAAAIAAGRRVIATRVGGLAEQLGRESLATLCDPEPAALAAALSAALSSLAPASTAPTDPRQAWQECAADLIEQIRPVLAARASRPARRVAVSYQPRMSVTLGGFLSALNSDSIALCCDPRAGARRRRAGNDDEE